MLFPFKNLVNVITIQVGIQCMTGSFCSPSVSLKLSIIILKEWWEILYTQSILRKYICQQTF